MLKKDRVNDGYSDRCYIYVRLEDFTDVEKAEREAIIQEERSRFAKQGPRQLELCEQEFNRVKVGDRVSVKYAYYPNILWGVSGHIRVPW